MATVLAIASLFLASVDGIRFPADTLFVAGSSFGTFEHASRIAFGPQGWIYIIDVKKNAVLIFKSISEPPFVLGGYGWSTTSFDRPSGVTTDGLNTYISDYGNHRIQRFDRYSNLISSLSTRDTSYAPARFGYPAGVALSTLGELLILDSENLRIVEFSADSRFERVFGGLSASGGQLQDPVKVCVGGDQYVYVLEKKGIVEFDYFGNYVRTFASDLGTEIVGGQATATGVVAVTSDTLYWFNVDGSLESKTILSSLISDWPIHAAQDIALDADRMFLLTATRCQIFRLESLNH
jgi:hypothetical protein